MYKLTFMSSDKRGDVQRHTKRDLLQKGARVGKVTPKLLQFRSGSLKLLFWSN